MNSFHLLYVGSDDGAATRLADEGGHDEVGLVTVATRPDVAATHLSRLAVDCVVVEYPLPGANVAAFLRRVGEVAPETARVLRLADTAVPPATDELWDQVCDASEDTMALAAAVSAAVDAPSADDLDDDTEHTSIYAARVGADGVVKRVNTPVVDDLDRPETSVVGETLSSLLPDEVADVLNGARERALASGTIHEREFRAGGRHFQVIAVPDEGDVEYFVQDITDAKLIERAFHEEQAFLDTVVDNLAELFFVLDGSGELVRWNDRVRERSGYSDAELASMNALDVVADENVEAAQEAIAETLETGHATVELTLTTADDEEIPFEFSGSVVHEGDGGPYICGIARDISDRRRTEQERDAAIEELRRSNAELEQFAYVASHDLQEPLRMISSYLQLLERRYRDSLDEDATEFIDYAVDGANRMREMINQLLVYSRIGREEIEFEPVDCNEILETVQADLRVAIEENDAEVVVDDLPTVPGNRHQLVQLFENSLGNAIKYAGDDPPRIEVRAERDGNGWRFAIEDNGRGIPPDQQDRIFDVFYAADGQKQTGIGLAIAKKIVERHGGRIWVESTVGEGSTFYFTLSESPSTAGPSAGAVDDLSATQD